MTATSFYLHSIPQSEAHTVNALGTKIQWSLDPLKANRSGPKII